MGDSGEMKKTEKNVRYGQGDRKEAVGPLARALRVGAHCMEVGAGLHDGCVNQRPATGRGWLCRVKALCTCTARLAAAAGR